MNEFDEFKDFYLLVAWNPIFKYFYFFMELLKVSKSQKHNAKFCTIEAREELGKHFIRFWDGTLGTYFAFEIYWPLDFILE